MNRTFDTRQRMALHRRAKGKCELCGIRIGSDFHADHRIPFALGGPTEVWNGQALCPQCNLRKTMNIDFSSVIPYGRPPREWQREFMVSPQRGIIPFFMKERSKDKHERSPYVLNAFPGTGKTYASLLAAAYLLETGVIEQVVYCVPWDNLREGAYKTALDLFGIELIETKKPENLLNLNDGINKGAVVSYGQLGGKCAAALQALCRDYRVLVIADEMHHLEEKSGWGASFQSTFRDLSFLLMTTGTPIRSDGSSMPYVTYKKDGRMQRIVTNFDFGYADALNSAEGPDVLQINFEPWDGTVRWDVKNEDGTATPYEHKISEDLRGTYLDRRPKAEIEQLERDRLRHCMDLPEEKNSEYLAKAFADADNWLQGVRKNQDRHATGLIVCSRCDEDEKTGRGGANQVAEWIYQQTGQMPAVIHGGDDGKEGTKTQKAEAVKWLKRYQSKHPSPDLPRWIVSVGMLKEGVDVPQLAALVYATNITAPLSWIQIVGRVLRIPLTGDKQFMAHAWMPRTPEFDELMRNMREAVQDYKHKKTKEGSEKNHGDDFGRDGRFRRETYGRGNEAEHDGSIHHDADGTHIHEESEIGKFRDLLPPGCSVAAVLSLSKQLGDTKEERMARFIKLNELVK